MNVTDVKAQLRDYIRTELLGRSDYPLDDDEALITGGLLDSFSLAQIGVFIEDAFDVYIPDSDLTVANMDNLNHMAARVMAHDEG